MDALSPRTDGRDRGFTLIELLVVVTLIGLLVSLAVPRYFSSIERGKRSVQAQNLQTVRDSIDKFYSDNARYPDSLEELVTRRYLRAMPIDPITEKSDWIIIAPPSGALPGTALGSPPTALSATSNPTPENVGNVYDVRSNVPETEH